jgi:hypothetical protein
MSIDLNLAITSVIAVSAVFSPGITAVINNRHQLKLKQMELHAAESKELRFYNRNIYEEYIINTLRCLYCNDETNISNYSKSYSLALIYFPKDIINILNCINNELMSEDTDADFVLSGIYKVTNRIHDIMRIP